MAFKPEQIEQLFDISVSRDLILMEAIKTEYCPGFKKLIEVVRSGAVGNIVDVEAAFTRLTLPGCREFNDLKFGGSFTEFGTYCLLPIFKLLGTDYKDVRFMSVPAMSDKNDNDYGSTVDGYTKVIVTYYDDTSMVKASGTAKTGLTVKSEGQLLISGTNGYILVPSPWWLTRHFEVRYEDHTKVDSYDCEFKGDGLRYEFDEFANRVDASGLPSSTIGIDDNENQKAEAVARARVYAEFLKNRQ